MKRKLATALLLAWMATVALAAWPSNVRPALLDAASHAAAMTLRLFGISAGQPLFQTEASPWKQHGFCFFLRRSGEPEAALLFPPGGDCRIEGFHARLPPVARANHRMLVTAWKQRAGPESGSSLLAGIGRAYCRAEEVSPAGVEGAWIWYYKHYETGKVLRRNGVWFDYSCEDDQVGEMLWHPTDEVLAGRWPEPLW